MIDQAQLEPTIYTEDSMTKEPFVSKSRKFQLSFPPRHYRSELKYVQHNWDICIAYFLHGLNLAFPIASMQFFLWRLDLQTSCIRGIYLLNHLLYILPVAAALSDLLPIKGRRRQPYLVMGGIICGSVYILLPFCSFSRGFVYCLIIPLGCGQSLITSALDGLAVDRVAHASVAKASRFGSAEPESSFDPVQVRHTSADLRSLTRLTVVVSAPLASMLGAFMENSLATLNSKWNSVSLSICSIVPFAFSIFVAYNVRDYHLIPPEASEEQLEETKRTRVAVKWFVQLRKILTYLFVGSSLAVVFLFVRCLLPNTDSAEGIWAFPQERLRMEEVRRVFYIVNTSAAVGAVICYWIFFSRFPQKFTIVITTILWAVMGLIAIPFIHSSPNMLTTSGTILMLLNRYLISFFAELSFVSMMVLVCTLSVYREKVENEPSPLRRVSTDHSVDPDCFDLAAESTYCGSSTRSLDDIALSEYDDPQSPYAVKDPKHSYPDTELECLCTKPTGDVAKARSGLPADHLPAVKTQRVTGSGFIHRVVSTIMSIGLYIGGLHTQFFLGAGMNSSELWNLSVAVVITNVERLLSLIILAKPLLH